MFCKLQIQRSYIASGRKHMQMMQQKAGSITGHVSKHSPKSLTSLQCRLPSLALHAGCRGTPANANPTNDQRNVLRESARAGVRTNSDISRSLNSQPPPSGRRKPRGGEGPQPAPGLRCRQGLNVPEICMQLNVLAVFRRIRMA